MNSNLTRLSAAALLVSFLGSPAIGQSNLRWVQTDSAPGTRLGTRLASAGDVDQDGFMDVLVGAPRATVRLPSTGTAHVLSGRDGSRLLSWNGESHSSWFGTAVDGGLDCNGDDVPDLLVGAPLGTPSSGSAFLYSGADGSLLASFAGDQPGDRFGAAVCLLGDVNGDKAIDFAIGAPHADGSGWKAGAVLVISGKDGSTLYGIEGQNADFLGFDLARLEDLDGDCVPELLIGAPFSDTAGFNAGSAYVHSGATGARLFSMHGANPGDWLGSRVASLGDVNRDGIPDCGLGVPGSDLGGLDSGAVEVRSGAGGGSLWAIPGIRSGEYMQTVGPLGDVNGDGFRDLVVGSASATSNGPESGRARLISGASGDTLATFGGRRLDWFGAAVVGLEHADGSIDLAVGAPGHDDHPEKHGSVRLLRASRVTPPTPPPAPKDCK